MINKRILYKPVSIAISVNRYASAKKTKCINSNGRILFEIQKKNNEKQNITAQKAILGNASGKPKKTSRFIAAYIKIGNAYINLDNNT